MRHRRASKGWTGWTGDFEGNPDRRKTFHITLGSDKSEKESEWDKSTLPCWGKTKRVGGGSAIGGWGSQPWGNTS